MFSNIDSGRSLTSVSTRQGAHRRRFLALMVGAPGFSGSTSQEGRRRCFLNN
jgi:hypothetical protein